MNIDPATAGMDAATLAQLDAVVRADIDAGKHFGATLLVARRGQIVHRANLGTTAPGRAAAEDDKYLLMSMSKAFTAVLVLRAIEQGQFGLKTRVAELMPDFAAHGKIKATVAQLLCHTAGLPTAPVPAPLPLTAMGDLARTSKAINRLKPVYEAGTRCAYTSGTGYDALGQILVLTDPKRRSFGRIAREELFEPLGLKNTSFGLAVEDPKRVPVSFTPSMTTLVSPTMSRVFNTVLDAQAEYPCAGAFADIGDVFAFTEALQGRGPRGFQLLAPATFANARKNHTGDMMLENLPTKGLPALRQMLATFGVKTLVAQVRSQRATQVDAYEHAAYPANFTLLGGYTRGVGNYLNPAGRTGSQTALAAVGGGSTGWMIDTERDLTVIFLSAGLVEGFAHPRRLELLNDLAIAAIRNRSR